MTAADALRRLLADVRASRAWLDGDGPESPEPPLVCKRKHDVFDYLERLALDGLAGKEHPPVQCPRHASAFCGCKPTDGDPA